MLTSISLIDIFVFVLWIALSGNTSCRCEKFQDFNLFGPIDSERNFSVVQHNVDLHSNVSSENNNSNVTFSEPSSVIIDVNANSSKSDEHLMDENRISDLKVTSVDFDKRMVLMKWTSNASLFELRYHPELEFIQRFFNSCMDNFVVYNKTTADSVYSIGLILPNEIIIILQERTLDRLYFAVKVSDVNGNTNNISNIAVAYFTSTATVRMTNYKSKLAEIILAAIVITSVVLALAISVMTLILVKTGNIQRTAYDFQKSEYYYETVTDASGDKI